MLNTILNTCGMVTANRKQNGELNIKSSGARYRDLTQFVMSVIH